MLTKDNKTGRARSGFFNGVVLLSASTLICKVIGLFFKIPIINIVGIDGMAYFSSAYNIYMLLNSIAAAGLPVALSIMVSKNSTVGNRANVRKTFSVALTLFLILGVLGMLCLYFGADVYSDAIGITESSSAVRAIAPTLLFICISGAVRGYFQGHEIMAPTAVSQLLESLGKLFLGVGFAFAAVNLGYDSSHTAAAAVAGLSAGVLISMIYLLARLALFGKTKVYKALPKVKSTADGKRKIIHDLFVIALPITFSSCITSLTSLADTALITNRLTSGGLAEDAAVTLYSSYTNLAIPLFNLPPALITPIAVSLVPALTSSITRKATAESSRIFSSSIRLCTALAIPAAAGMSVYAHPILDLIYPGEPEACAFAAPLLSVLSIAILFSCLTTVTNAVLQTYMKPGLPIVSMAVGAVVKVVAEYVLVGSDIGIMGAPISTVACTFTILLLNLTFITIHTPHRFELGMLLRVFFASALSIGSSAVIYCLLGKTMIASYIVLMLTIITAVLLYAICALLLGIVRYSDIKRLPFGERIGNILKRIKLIKE